MTVFSKSAQSARVLTVGRAMLRIGVTGILVFVQEEIRCWQSTKSKVSDLAPKRSKLHAQ